MSLTLALLLAALAAAEPAAETELAVCLEASDGTNTAWGQCTGAEVERQERALNQTWKRVYGKLSGQTKADLLTEQRAWITYKDASCRFWANGDWGREGQVLHAGECRAAVIDERIRWLEELERELTGDDR